jgi:hypothetical protein
MSAGNAGLPLGEIRAVAELLDSVVSGLNELIEMFEQPPRGDVDIMLFQCLANRGHGHVLASFDFREEGLGGIGVRSGAVVHPRAMNRSTKGRRRVRITAERGDAVFKFTHEFYPFGPIPFENGGKLGIGYVACGSSVSFDTVATNPQEGVEDNEGGIVRGLHG